MLHLRLHLCVLGHGPGSLLAGRSLLACGTAGESLGLRHYSLRVFHSLYRGILHQIQRLARPRFALHNFYVVKARSRVTPDVPP